MALDLVSCVATLPLDILGVGPKTNNSLYTESHTPTFRPIGPPECLRPGRGQSGRTNFTRRDGEQWITTAKSN